MDITDKLDLRQIIRVPSNRYLRHQYTKVKYQSIFTFLINNASFGIEKAKIKAIMRNNNVLSFASLPAHIAGLVKQDNLIVPVVDLRQYLQLPAADINQSKIIIIQLEKRLIGLLVEDVTEPVLTKDMKLVALHNYQSVIKNQFLLGMAKTKQGDIMMLDAEKFLATDALMTRDEATTLDRVINLVSKL